MKDIRGSYWRKCDFHVHTPSSALSNGFGDDFDHYVQTLFKKAIEKKIQIIGITDYFTIDGYKKIKLEYLEKPEKLASLFSPEEIVEIKNIMLLPNVEFRINKIVQINKYKDGQKISTENGRVNFHVLFSDELPIKLIEESFLHDLQFIYEADPNEPDKKKKLKVENLARLGERLKSEQPDLDGTPLQVGMKNAIVDDEQITELLTRNRDFADKYLIIVPADEDLSELSWKSQEHQTRKVLLSRAHGFFSSNSNTVQFGLGEKSNSQDEFVREFKSIKPCIWGSDAHNYDKLFEPDYLKYCWVKSDATFDGIRQILFEPKDRVFIGEYPELFTRIRSAKGNYINSISITNQPNYDGRKGIWFKDFEMQFGYELIAIIGNKGKGKSAVADIVALLGNSHVKRSDFSFLNQDKFCQKGYAENFSGILKWWDGSKRELSLNETVDVTDVERVKYIPQSYLEKLCNSEDSGFREEINKVVFSRLADTDKLGKKTFAELEAHNTQTINQQIALLLNKMEGVNHSIDLLEKKSIIDYQKSIENKKLIKDKELENHQREKANILVVTNPEMDTNLSADQRAKAESISKIDAELKTLELLIGTNLVKLSEQKIKLSELNNLLAEVSLQEKNFTDWKAAKDEVFQKYGLNANRIISLQVDTNSIETLIRDIDGEIDAVTSLVNEDSNSWDTEKNLVFKTGKLLIQKQEIEKDLEKPVKEYQDYLFKIKEWEAKQKSLLGSENQDDTIAFYQAELNYIEKRLPQELAEQTELRRSITQSIFEQKQQVQAIFNKIKQSIASVLSEYSAEQNISIETSFKVDKQFYSQFFDYVNRYGKFYLNGDEELRKMMLKFNFDEVGQVMEFLNQLQLEDIRFKDNRQVDFYNYICSLSYLRPEYDLRLNSKSLSQLSPGEKGGLLLVFYLVLDKDNKPLIIDQPEDNLDNQSVAEILVPYIKRAKKLRQIFMVTHNPNLAIVADAEQIIYMNIDKENNYVVSYDSGGIEDSAINNHIVDILEGKMKAFDNRRVKYKKSIA